MSFQQSNKVVLAAALVAGASAFTVQPAARSSTALFNGPVIGKGGMADTRDPDACMCPFLCIDLINFLCDR